MTKELKKRIVTSAVLAAIVLNCLFINNFSWLLLLSIVSFICWFEFINLFKRIWKKKIHNNFSNNFEFSLLVSVHTYSL